jgi:hypothetical protein
MHRLPLLLLPLLGCAPEEPTPVDGGSANYSASLGEGPDFSEPHGRIEVETWLEWGDTQLSGAFADGPAPRHHSEAQRIGSCRIMTYTPSSCEPSCEGYDVCVDGACEPWPTYLDRGTLRWTWPDGEQEVVPNEWYGYWASGSASSQGEVSIEVEGLLLEAPTIDTMEPDGDWADAVSSRGDGDATLRWSNPVLDARVRLHMTDCTGSHGGLAAAEVECEGPDTGSLVIPGAFLDSLDAGDWSHGECGSHELHRYHAATPEGDTTVRLETRGPSGFFYRPDWSH